MVVLQRGLVIVRHSKLQPHRQRGLVLALQPTLLAREGREEMLHSPQMPFQGSLSACAAPASSINHVLIGHQLFMQ